MSFITLTWPSALGSTTTSPFVVEVHVSCTSCGKYSGDLGVVKTTKMYSLMSSKRPFAKGAAEQSLSTHEMWILWKSWCSLSQHLLVCRWRLLSLAAPAEYRPQVDTAYRIAVIEGMGGPSDIFARVFKRDVTYGNIWWRCIAFKFFCLNLGSYVSCWWRSRGLGTSLTACVRLEFMLGWVSIWFG